jgi:hypothetical protein
MSIDWNDPVQMRKYKREWAATHRENVKQQKLQMMRERGAHGDIGPICTVINPRGKENHSFWDAAFSVANDDNDLNWELNINKHMEGNEE